MKKAKRELIKRKREDEGENRGKKGREMEGEEKEGKSEKDGQGERWKIAFWNIAGMRNKDKGFWDRIGTGEWDVITLMETWVDEKGWRKVKNWLPKGFKWGVQFASKKNKKGRAMGWMIMEIKGRGGIKMGKIETGEEGMMIGKWKVGKEE